MRRVTAALFALGLLCHVDPAWPEGEPAPPPTPAARAGLEAASIAGTVVYTPAKATLCFLGLATSPLLYLSSGAHAVRDVTRRTCTGSWIITPEILRGDTPFRPVQDTPCCGYAEP